MNRSLIGALAASAFFVGVPTVGRAQHKPTVAEQAAQARLRAADSTTTFMVKLRDGSSFAGRVLLMRNDSVSFTSSVGPFMLAIRDVQRLTVIRSRDIQNGAYWFPGPTRTRLLIAPTGRTLAQKEGHYSVTQLFFTGFEAGLTDRITLGGGISLIPYVDLANQIAWATPKVGLVAREDLHLAVGAMAFSSSGTMFRYDNDNDRQHHGMLYSVGTFGGPHTSVTTGVGFPYWGTRLSGSPVVLLGGESRASTHTALVAEAYLSEGGILTALGWRVFSETVSADFGLYTNAGANGFLFPFVAFTANF